MKKILRFLMPCFAILIGIYPVIYLIIDRRFGLLASKSDALLANVLWNVSFYVHIILGGIALLIGWIQFNDHIRLKNLTLHRTIGKIYVYAVLLSALGGIVIGFSATGGWISASGFVCLGIVWFTSTLLAFLAVRKKEIEKHKVMMIYSYSACFAAVTLRLWLPLLSMHFNNAYLIVAWLCWVPNLIVAYFITQKLKISYTLKL
jgi:uncharacterized membrane protein